ncbi:MAG: intradiol ring-cleavage dioxygenase [Alphaproteobacteria bacterium]|nr:intradiol ring-cleavage dioxygenase [Alphaproteobacteria bacterium]
MSRIATPAIGRRHALRGGLVVAVAGLSAAADGPAARAAARSATPRQTEGPFYPVDWSGDADADLVQVHGEAARATGRILHLRGRVVGLDGSPRAGARVEIWQCDAQGVYRHPRDERGGRRREPGFQGRGFCSADADGAYGFRTIRPVAYPGRTPHIHVKVTAPGHATLVTQAYVDGEPQNERDAVLNAIRDPRQRASVIMRLEPAERIEAGALAGLFDIVLA